MSELIGEAQARAPLPHKICKHLDLSLSESSMAQAEAGSLDKDAWNQGVADTAGREDEKAAQHCHRTRKSLGRTAVENLQPRKGLITNIKVRGAIDSSSDITPETGCAPQSSG